MKISFLYLFLILTLIIGCNKKEEIKKDVTNGNFIEKLVGRAISGNRNANDSLGNLVNLTLPVNDLFNDLIVDSINSNSGKIFYTILLQYPNPVYDRLAVYDTALHTYLIDKSINGKFKMEKLTVEGISFLQLNEQFISKDIFRLERISLYSVSDSSVNLVFRTFTKMEDGKRSYEQQLKEISPERITTTLTSSRYSKVGNKSDVFSFDQAMNKYVSTSNLFDSYITGLIISSKNKITQPEFTDENSAWASTGYNPTPQAQNTVINNNTTNTGFSISLSDDWKEFKNFAVSQFLNKEIKGTRYLNSIIGTTISIIEIPAESATEDFTNYKLDKSSTEGKISIRYTEMIKMGKTFAEIYEYTCGSRKFILIIKGSKFTYNEYSDLYQKIIHSFSMEC